MSAAAPAPDFGSRSDFYTFAPETLASELPDFKILGEVGKGSMGIVFEARRCADGARVALKVLPPSLTLTERALARFLREAELMSRVRHPAIVQAYEHGRQGRLHYFVMEFVEGMTLEERVRVGPLPVRQAAEIGARVARALHFAHDRGVLHRDVKPGNLMLRDDGRVAITDFGLARETGAGSMTESGSIVGTPKYMAPEQVLGDRSAIDTRSDVYGLGATMYELVTAVPPFTAATAQGVLQAVLEQDPIPPRRLRANLPAELEAVILSAMEKDPAQRYGSAAEMAEDLERFLRGERVQVRRPGVARRLYRAASRHRQVTLLVVVVALLALAGTGLWHEHRQNRLIDGVQEAEAKFLLASGVRDDQLAPLSAQARRGYLEAAVDRTTEVIDEDPTLAAAWMVRAQARHRLQHYAAALADFDAAERCRGEASVAILHFRIDTLRHLDGPSARRRLLADLTSLLQVDPGTTTQSLVAAILVDLASETTPSDRDKILEQAAATLARIVEPNARAAVTRVRVLELRGDLTGAERAMQEVRGSFHGNPFVHRQAAELFGRLGKTEQSEREASLARSLDPLGWTGPSETAEAVAAAQADRANIDINEVRGFLQQLDGLMQAIQSK